MEGCGPVVGTESVPLGFWLLCLSGPGPKASCSPASVSKGRAVLSQLTPELETEKEEDLVDDAQTSARVWRLRSRRVVF